MRLSPLHRVRHGFTLIEMSIVLLVIGLVMGGIFLGQELFRVSQVNSVAADLSRFRVAFDGFKLKYNALPGDMSDATRYWGAVSSCPGGSGSGTQTCNGNGDGYVGNSLPSEALRIWQHLAAAGFIPNPKTGYFTGVPGALGYSVGGLGDMRVGVNVPSSRVKNVGYAAFYIGGIGAGHPYYFKGDYGNALMIGAQAPGYEPATPAFTPAEAKGLDDKFDDGKPGAGRLVTRPSIATAGSPNCNNATSGSDTGTTYALSYNAKACYMYLLHGVQ